MQSYINTISDRLSLPAGNVATTIQLIQSGATIPFLARYRKEATGSLDEVQLTEIKHMLLKLTELEQRRVTVLKSIEEQGHLTDELKKKIEEAETITELEDLYLPYKPKRRTRAMMAKEKGLEPLAEFIWKENQQGIPSVEAQKFVDEEKGITTFEEALSGARDIIAERLNETVEIREIVRSLFQKEAVISSKVIKGKEEAGQKFKDYFDWSEKLKNIPSHRLLAIRRGEKELFLRVDIAPDKEEAVQMIKRKLPSQFLPEVAEQLELAAEDSYIRLIKPSIETEIRVESKKKADAEAIAVFRKNLGELLMAPALGEKSVLAVDPGFRTGCKVVCIDRQGKLLENATIYPNEPKKKTQEAEAIIRKLMEDHKPEVVAIGNGTASRETESFFKKRKVGIPVVMVNESGASIYSASEVARAEFPDYDVTVRGAVSIGRRLQDPLAELVKIDPKSIGVGQYQHDVDQNDLKDSLEEVVESCVNRVGVELNTASKQLLTYVSGLGPALAQNVIDYRKNNGAFKSRKELMDVARMGDKAFEQAAGFLRIRNAENPLDSSAVHPERYQLVSKMAEDMGVTTMELAKQPEVRKGIDISKYVSEEVGLPTLKDILQELEKPGRDPREAFELFSFKEGIEKIEDLRVGLELPGIVTNVTKFGAFVDIGVHQDGLVHISEMTNQFIDDPSKVVKVQQKVQVRVIEVDVARKRISLSMKGNEKPKGPKPGRKKQKRKESGPQDMASKLAMLKNKFGSN